MEAIVAARRRHRELLLRHASVYDCELQEVVDKLFIGSIGGVLAPGVLEQNDVTHVLCVSTGVKEDVLRIKAPDASISVERLEDSSNDPQDFLQALPALLGFVAAVISDGYSILVCSFRGRSRAAAVVIAHLMLAYGSSLQEAAAHVAGVRDCAVPNPGFIVALWALEAAITAECVVGSMAAGLTEDEYSKKLLALVQVALSVLPGIIGGNPLPSSLPILDGRVLSLPEGLEDLSLQKLEEEVASLQGTLDNATRDSTNGISVDLDTLGEREGSPPSEGVCLDGNEAENNEAIVAELEARKAEAVACNDFDEASRLRDQIRSLKAVGGEPLETTEKAQPTRAELIARKKVAVEREDWSEAAKLRDLLRKLGDNDTDDRGMAPPPVSSMMKNNEFEDIDLDTLNAVRSSLETQLAEAKLNLTKVVHEEVEEDSHARGDAPLEQEEARTFWQKCVTYPVASLSIVLMTVMCIHGGVLLVSSVGMPQEL